MTDMLFGAETPATPDVSDGPSYSLSTRFIPSVNGYVTHARWYFPGSPQSGGTQVNAAIYRVSDQVQIGSTISFSATPVLAAWNIAAFSGPGVLLTAGVQYAITVWAKDHYVVTSPYSWPKTSGYLTTPSPAGYFKESPGGIQFPDQIFNTPTYFADVVFEPILATPVHSSLTVKWRIYNSVTSSLRAKWNVYNSIHSSLRVKWRVFVEDSVFVLSSPLLVAQRAVTAAFIANDPTTASLTPRTKVKTASGGFTYEDGTPRNPQTFKLSLLAYDQRPTVTFAGVERTVDYHLIGPHDMQIGVGDWWVSGGTRYDVVGFSEGFGYETKAFVSRQVPPAVKI